MESSNAKKAGFVLIGTFFSVPALVAYHFINNEWHMPGSVTVAHNNSIVTNEIAICPQLHDEPELVEHMAGTLSKLTRLNENMER